MIALTIRQRLVSSIVAIAGLALSFLVFGPERPAFGSEIPTGEICPSSAKTLDHGSTWSSRLNSYDDSGFAAEAGTLSGCATNVSITAPSKVDYYVYFDAASLAGKDLFSDGSLLTLTVTGAPGAAGWYIQAFDTTVPSAPLTRTFGGGGTPNTDGRANYDHPLTLRDGTVTTQPALSGSPSAPAPTYSITYGYTLSSSQKTSIEAGNLAIYIGYLGSSSAGATDIIESVKLNYFVPVAESETEVSGVDSIPGIYLAIAGPVGRHQESSPIYFGANQMMPNSEFELSAVSISQPMLARQILAEGIVNPWGHLESRVQLGASTLSPGIHAVRMRGIAQNGLHLTLTAEIEIGSDGRYRLIGENIPGFSSGN